MIRRFRILLLSLPCLLPAPGLAQELAGCQSSTQLSFRLERVGADHYRRIGAVEIDCGDTKFYAEEVELFTDTSRLVATGNVVFTSRDSQIAADRVEFDTKAGTGTFFNASGIAFIKEQGTRSMFGSQEPEAYFYAEKLEKIGQRKYRLTNGAFTTCVQPTPRWELVSSTVIVNLDDYALLKNSVLRVKGVPLLYLPLLYYPLHKEERATGFLIPSYGTSTFRGQSISNAFFWAISRSQDATFFHDWFTSIGQGLGGEYRYVLGPGSEGAARAYVLDERATTLANGTALPGRRSYEVRGGATHVVNEHLRARGRADYFSDVTVQQLYHANVFDASRRQRLFAGNLTGSWDVYTVNGSMDWNEVFFGERSSTLFGAAPRFSFTRAERPLVGRAIYFSVGAEYATLLRRSRGGDEVIDSGLTRADVAPVVRVPFTRWPFLTVNSSVAWRYTLWTERLDPDDRRQIDETISRRFLDLQSQITGPVLVRIWDGSARRYKHVIEPSVTLQRVTAIDNFDFIVPLDGIDTIVGGSTRIAYGITNRFYAKRREAGPGGTAQEILNVALVQSYYTDARAAQFDRMFRTSFNRTAPSHLSPIALVVRASPTREIDATLRAEYDTQFRAVRTIAADGSVAAGAWLRASAGWSQRRFIRDLPGFDDPARLDHYLNASATARGWDNRVGGTYAFNYDVLRGTLLQQRLVGYYNAQCCGFAVEYQTFDFQGLGSRAPVARDRRFNVSFTLAGIGTFSNFFGALGGGSGQP